MNPNSLFEHFEEKQGVLFLDEDTGFGVSLFAWICLDKKIEDRIIVLLLL